MAGIASYGGRASRCARRRYIAFSRAVTPEALVVW